MDHGKRLNLKDGAKMQALNGGLFMPPGSKLEELLRAETDGTKLYELERLDGHFVPVREAAAVRDVLMLRAVKGKNNNHSNKNDAAPALVSGSSERRHFVKDTRPEQALNGGFFMPPGSKLEELLRAVSERTGIPDVVLARVDGQRLVELTQVETIADGDDVFFFSSGPAFLSVSIGLNCAAHLSAAYLSVLAKVVIWQKPRNGGVGSRVGWGLTLDRFLVHMNEVTGFSLQFDAFCFKDMKGKEAIMNFWKVNSKIGEKLAPRLVIVDKRVMAPRNRSSSESPDSPESMPSKKRSLESPATDDSTRQIGGNGDVHIDSIRQIGGDGDVHIDSDKLDDLFELNLQDPRDGDDSSYGGCYVDWYRDAGGGVKDMGELSERYECEGLHRGTKRAHGLIYCVRLSDRTRRSGGVAVGGVVALCITQALSLVLVSTLEKEPDILSFVCWTVVAADNWTVECTGGIDTVMTAGNILMEFGDARHAKEKDVQAALVVYAGAVTFMDQRGRGELVQQDDGGVLGVGLGGNCTMVWMAAKDGSLLRMDDLFQFLEGRSQKDPTLIGLPIELVHEDEPFYDGILRGQKYHDFGKRHMKIYGRDDDST